MIVVFGSTLYGKVESVPRVGHIATRFLHFLFIPLFPTGSWLVVHKSARTAGGAEAIKLPAMHWGSGGMGFLRFLLLVIIYGLAIVIATKVGLARPWSQTAPLIVGALACAGGFLGSYRLMRPRRETFEAMRGASAIPSALLERFLAPGAADG